MSNQLTRHKTLEEEELERKSAELAQVQAELAEQELMRATLRSELLAFERD